MSLDVRFSAYMAPWMENCFKVNEAFKVSQILFLVNGEKIQVIFLHRLGIMACNLHNWDNVVDISISGAGYFKREEKLLT